MLLASDLSIVGRYLFVQYKNCFGLISIMYHYLFIFLSLTRDFD